MRVRKVERAAFDGSRAKFRGRVGGRGEFRKARRFGSRDYTVRMMVGNSVAGVYAGLSTVDVSTKVAVGALALAISLARLPYVSDSKLQPMQLFHHQQSLNHVDEHFRDAERISASEGSSVMSAAAYCADVQSPAHTPFESVP